MSSFNLMMVLDSMESGGTETHALSVARVMKKQGAKVIFAGGQGNLYPVFCEEFPTYRVPFDWNPLKEQRWVNQLASLMEEEQIQLVHIHQTPSGRLAALAAAKRNIPVVFTIHGTYYPRNELLTVAGLSDRVISVSKPVRQYWLYAGVDSQVIPNGIDLAEFTQRRNAETLRKQLGISKDAIVLTYASRLAWQKGKLCMMVLRSAKDLRATQFPKLEVVIAGDGPDMNAVRELKGQLEWRLGSQFIHLIGERREMAECYQMSDCVVGTGRVALEAMACGIPVLGIGSHGFIGWVEPATYQHAWDCYFGDHHSLRNHSQPLLTDALRKGLNHPDLLRRIGESGREWVKQAFDINIVGMQIAEVYQSLLR